MAVLQSGERVVMGGDVREIMQRGSLGLLTLTNRHIIFERVEGTRSRKSHIVFEVPLSCISNVWVKGFLARKLVLEIYWDETPNRYQFKTARALEWLAAIRAASKQKSYVGRVD